MEGRCPVWLVTLCGLWLHLHHRERTVDTWVTGQLLMDWIHVADFGGLCHLHLKVGHLLRYQCEASHLPRWRTAALWAPACSPTTYQLSAGPSVTLSQGSGVFIPLVPYGLQLHFYLREWTVDTRETFWLTADRCIYLHITHHRWARESGHVPVGKKHKKQIQVCVEW